MAGLPNTEVSCKGRGLELSADLVSFISLLCDVLASCYREMMIFTPVATAVEARRSNA